DPRTGIRRWSARLHDAPQVVAFGEECLTVTAIDDSSTSFVLSTGAATQCPSARAERPPIEAGGISMMLSTVTKGTPRIVVTGSRGDMTVWEKTLDIATDDFPVGVPNALSASGLVVAGKQPGTESMGVVLLGPGSGKILASREVPQRK